MDITYCYEHCTIGKANAEKFLTMQNSVIDAALDFQYFTTVCFETCPYKQAHVDNKNER